MLSFFKKKAAKSEEAANGKTMKAYLTGKVIPIEEVNDEIHSHISDEMFRKKQERSKDYER